MSGGRWDYVGGKINADLERLAEDPDIKVRWPRVADLLSELGGIIHLAEHEMDWDICGDHAIPDDAAFEWRIMEMILMVAMRAAPDAWFPRGKWATIQVIRARKGAGRD